MYIECIYPLYFFKIQLINTDIKSDILLKIYDMEHLIAAIIVLIYSMQKMMWKLRNYL